MFVSVYIAAKNAVDDKNVAYLLALCKLVVPANLPGLPTTPENFPLEYAACNVIPSVYGYCSLIIYLAGETITERNSISITQERPDSLVTSFNIRESEAFILTGAGQMGSAAHSHVNQAWRTYTEVRQAIVSEVATYASAVSIPKRVVYTTIKSLEFTGMHRGYLIFKFLEARPECVHFDCTRASLTAYYSSIREVAAAPAHHQPYYKLIYSDSTEVFHRNTIMPLASCAMAYQKYTAPSMVNFVLGEAEVAVVNMYKLGEADVAAVNMYNAEAKRRGERLLYLGNEHLS